MIAAHILRNGGTLDDRQHAVAQTVKQHKQHNPDLTAT